MQTSKSENEGKKQCQVSWEQGRGAKWQVKRWGGGRWRCKLWIPCGESSSNGRTNCTLCSATCRSFTVLSISTVPQLTADVDLLAWSTLVPYPDTSCCLFAPQRFFSPVQISHSSDLFMIGLMRSSDSGLVFYRHYLKVHHLACEPLTYISAHTHCCSDCVL